MQITSDSSSSTESTASYKGGKEAVSEFRKMLDDIDNLIRSSTSFTKEELAELNEMIRKRIHLAHDFFMDKRESAVNKLNDASVRTNAYAHKQPWTVMGGGLLVGVLCGFLLAHRRADRRT